MIVARLMCFCLYRRTRIFDFFDFFFPFFFLMFFNITIVIGG